MAGNGSYDAQVPAAKENGPLLLLIYAGWGHQLVQRFRRCKLCTVMRTASALSLCGRNETGAPGVMHWTGSVHGAHAPV
jgi:hypothetical protein